MSRTVDPNHLEWPSVSAGIEQEVNRGKIPKKELAHQARGGGGVAWCANKNFLFFLPFFAACFLLLRIQSPFRLFAAARPGTKRRLSNAYARKQTQ